MKVRYKIYNPAGNITALVIGDDYSLDERRLINNKIMELDSKIEQVGFVSIKEKRLIMAGGEFCGNAIRCAIMHYNIKDGNILINKQNINGGIGKYNNVWCEIPINKYKITNLKENINKIELEGITMIIISRNLSKKYLSKDLKEVTQNIINLYKLRDNDAVGVIFLEESNDLKIYPVVWVKAIDTLFLENACGSGTIAATILEAVLQGKDGKYLVLQPSGEVLETKIKLKNKKVTRAVLSGKIYTDNKIREINI